MEYPATHIVFPALMSVNVVFETVMSDGYAGIVDSLNKGLEMDIDVSFVWISMFMNMTVEDVGET